VQFTRASDYAVRVLSYLINANGSVSRAQSIAAATEIPESFLAKILGQLCRSGLVRSHRGARGGFSLAAPPASLNLLQVVEAMEGPLRLNICDAPERCAFIDSCPIEKAWEKAEQTLRESLQEHKLADLAKQADGVGLFTKKIA
jgi:Rrf2 family protein